MELYITLSVLAALLLLLSSIARLWSSQPMWRSFVMPDRKGYIDDEEYFVEHYNEDTSTISVTYPKNLQVRFEMHAPFSHEEKGIMKSLKALDAAGVDYIDIGYHANWIAAEIPYRNLQFLKISYDDFFKKTARELISLRNTLLKIDNSLPGLT